MEETNKTRAEEFGCMIKDIFKNNYNEYTFKTDKWEKLGSFSSCNYEEYIITSNQWLQVSDVINESEHIKFVNSSNVPSKRIGAKLLICEDIILECENDFIQEMISKRFTKCINMYRIKSGLDQLLVLPDVGLSIIRNQCKIDDLYITISIQQQ